MDSVGTGIWRALTWLLGLSAYMLLIVDRFPTLDDDSRVRIELERGGQPTASSALARLVTSIPSALVLLVLGWVSGLLLIVGIVTILVGNTVPKSIVAFQTGILRWQARLLAYHASFIDEYPPFSFEDFSTPKSTTAAS
jgi:hypothetical protein